jgi:hypothetical protein
MTTHPTSESAWAGQWCWVQKHLSRPWNYYAYFRRRFTRSGKPQRAVVRVSADARYTLFVNGRRVHQGPARSYPRFQSYDTLELADWLQAGENTLCAVCHQFGVPTFQSVYRDISGFLLDGVVEIDGGGGEQVPLHTPGGWRCQPAQAWRKDVARLSVQLGFQEHFDADADPAGWMGPEYEASDEQGWREPWTIGPVGCHPWLSLEPRTVPLLADRLERPTAVLALFGGENARGYKIAADVYHLPLQEKHAKAKLALENPEAMLGEDAALTTVPPPPDGEYLLAVLDLGTYRTGHVRLEIAEAAGDEIIDILYSEMIDEKTKFPVIVGEGKPVGSEEAMADRYRCRAGAQTWEAFWPKGMRYLTLIFRNVEKPLKIGRVAVRVVQAGLEEAGAFTCSDERLNEIWKVGRHTQINCALDSFVDCPWREQAQWWGDARVQGRVTAYAFGDSTLLERGIRQMAQSQGPDGSLHSHPPADIPGHRLPDFMMVWVGTLWDHYWHTGQPGLLAECLPTLHRVFEFFAAHVGSEGLIGGFGAGWWLFLDWKPLFKGDYSAVFNLMYLQALRWAESICRVVGDEVGGARYGEQAAALAEAAERSFWDEQQKVWRDGWDAARQEPVESVSQHANALAILLGLKPQTHEHLAKEVLLKGARSRRGKVIEASPFFYAYVLESLATCGHRAEVVELIREKWGAMVEAGASTFWEGWDGAGSRCHAWSASPVYHLSQQILGVVPVEAGWKRVRVAPLPAGLEFARGVVPSPLGPIRVEWEMVEEDQLAVRVDIPEGMEGEFVGPLGETRALGAGGHEFHT